jgi:cell division septum initiation protein DivIVA
MKLDDALKQVKAAKIDLADLEKERTTLTQEKMRVDDRLKELDKEIDSAGRCVQTSLQALNDAEVYDEKEESEKENDS